MLHFLGQIKPEDAEQFQHLQPGKWGVYYQGDFWFVSPITIEPFNHHVIGNKKWLEEDYGIKELLHLPHVDILKEIVENTPDIVEWTLKRSDGEEPLIFDMTKFKGMVRKEIENPTIKDNFI